MDAPIDDFLLSLPKKVLPFTESDTLATKANYLHLASCIALEKRGVYNRFHWENESREDGLYLLKFTLEGVGYLRDHERGETHELPPGHAFLIPNKSRTCYFAEEGKPWTFIWVNFIGKAANTLCTELTKINGYTYSLIDYPMLVDALTQLYQYRLENQQYDSYFVSSQVYRILMLLFQLHDSVAPSIPSSILNACEHMKDFIGDSSLAIEDVASVAGYSKYHFTRKFKQYMRRSPHQYLIKIRLEKAVELITTTDLPIKVISERVGFKEVPHFYNVFKKNMRITPGSLNRPMH